MEQIDVLSYHCSVPQPESSYSTKSTADLTPSRQRFIDSIVRQKNQNKHERHSSWTESNKLGQQFIVPNLYANQRVRQRSFSKDPPKPPKLQRDLKKTVAFGLTTTIGDNFNSLRPSTSTSSLYQPNSKLQNNHLHNNRIEANSQLRKDVDQIQKVVKSLIEENVELQACYHENRKLHADVKQLNKTVQELSESNSALMTRVNLLEIWYSRLNENQKRELSTTTHLINKKMSDTSLKSNYSSDWRTKRRIAHIYIDDSNSKSSDVTED